jgi:hypothetical protein
MRFNRLFLTQGNPSWADYYVHYRRLRTLVKKMVFTWHKGALWQVPVRYGVDDAPVLYSTAELIPPKLPADDSDSDGDDEALDGPSPLPSDVAAAADAAATAAVTAAATAGGAGAGERSPLLPTVATSLLARVDPATLTKKQAKQLKKQLRKEEKHRRRAAVAAANVATPTDGGRYGSGGNGDDDDDDDDDIERGPKTNSGGGYGSLATMFSPAASSHTETPVSDRWSPASGSVTGSGISASPLTPRAGAGASGLKPGKGKGKKNRSGASGTSGALSPYGPPPGFDGPNMTMSGVRYRKIARSRYNTLTSVNGASTGTGIAGAGGSNAWPPLPPLPAPSAAAGRLPLSAAAGAGAFGAGGYSGYNAGGSNGGSGFGGSYGNGSGVGGYNNGSEGARLSKKDRKKLKKAEKKVRRQQELHRLIGASPFASPSPASSGPGAAGTAGASVGAGAGAVIRVNGQTPLLVSPSAAAAAAAAGGKKGGSKGAKKPEKEDEEEGDDHFDVERGPPSKDRQSKGLPSISAADPSSSVAAETHEAAVASLAAALDSPHAIPDSALVAVAPSGLTLNSGGGLSLSHVAPSRAGGLGSNGVSASGAMNGSGVSASGAMNGSGVKGLSLRVQSSPSLTALAQLAAAKDVAATAAGTAKDAAAAPAGPDAAAGAGAIPLTASDLFFSPAGTNPSVLAQIAASGNKLTAKSTTTAAVTGTGASSSGTEPHAQQPPSVSRPLSSVPSLSKSPSVIGAGPAAGTATGVAGISAGSQQQQQSANPSPLSTAAAAAAAATDAPSLPSLPPPHMSWAQSGSQSLASGSQSLAHGSSQSRASPYHSAAAQESAQAQALALSPAHSAGVRAPVKAAIGAVTSAAASAASVAASAASAVASVLRPHSRAQDHHPVEPEAAGGGGGGAVVDADADADADGASGNSAPVLTSASRPTKATAMSNPQVEVYEGMMRDFWHQMRLDYEHVDAFYRSTVSALTVGMERVGNTSRDVYGRRPLYMPSDGGSNGGSYQYQNQQYGPGGGDSSDPASSPSGGGGGGGDEAHYYVPDEARYGALLAIYETICELRLFCSLNTTALRKLLKKYEKYSPKVQTAAGAKIPVSAPLTSKFAAQLRVSSFVTQDDLRALTAQVFSQVARDKLFAIESHVMTKRLNGDSDAGGAHGVKSGLFRTVKVVPLLVSLALFLAILWLPLDLPHSPAADAAVVTTGTAAAGASTGALKLPHAAAPKLLTLNGAGAGTGTDTDTDADADLDGNADANPENVAATAALAAAFEPVDDAAIAALLSPTLSGSSSSMSARAPDAGAGPATVVAARTAPVAPAPVQGQGQGQGGNAAPGVVAGAPGAGAKKKAAPKRVAPQLISNQAHKYVVASFSLSCLLAFMSLLHMFSRPCISFIAFFSSFCLCAGAWRCSFSPSVCGSLRPSLTSAQACSFLSSLSCVGSQSTRRLVRYVLAARAHPYNCNHSPHTGSPLTRLFVFHLFLGPARQGGCALRSRPHFQPHDVSHPPRLRRFRCLLQGAAGAADRRVLSDAPGSLAAALYSRRHAARSVPVDVDQ